MFVRLTELRPVTARDTLYRFTCPAIARAARDSGVARI